MTHREGAIKLLEQTLGISFEGKAPKNDEEPIYIRELWREEEEAKEKEAQKQKEIKAMEAMGYDMSDYKGDIEVCSIKKNAMKKQKENK